MSQLYPKRLVLGGGAGPTVPTSNIFYWDTTQPTDAANNRYDTWAATFAAAKAITDTQQYAAIDVTASAVAAALGAGVLVIPSGTYDGNGYMALFCTGDKFLPLNNSGAGIVTFQDFCFMGGLNILDSNTTVGGTAARDVQFTMSNTVGTAFGELSFYQCTLTGKTGAGARDCIDASAATVPQVKFTGCALQDNVFTTAGLFSLITFGGNNTIQSNTTPTSYSIADGATGQVNVKGPMPTNATNSGGAGSSARWALFSGLISYDNVAASEVTGLLIDPVGQNLPFVRYNDCSIIPSVAGGGFSAIGTVECHGENTILGNAGFGALQLPSEILNFGRMAIDGTGSGTQMLACAGLCTIKNFGNWEMPNDDISGAGTVTFETYSGNKGGINFNQTVANFNVSDLRSRNVQVAFYQDTGTQIPTAVDTPLQVTLGPATGAATDPVQVSAAGDITFNQEGEYTFQIVVQAERTGGGGSATLLSYATLNGVQGTATIVQELPNANVKNPIIATIRTTVAAGDILRLFIVRDSSGANDGQLSPFTPALGTVNVAPSASIKIFRRV